MKDFGWYHVSWSSKIANKIGRQMADLRKVASAGCTLMAVSDLQNLAATKKLLDAAASYKVKLIIEDLPQVHLEEVKNHPALLAVTIADDANKKPLQPLKTATTSCPTGTYLSVGPGYSNSCAEYYITDLVGVQTYTYPYESLKVTYDMLYRARLNANKSGKKLVANLQCHNIGGGMVPWYYAYSQVWVAELVGVDAVLGYTLVDDGGFVTPRVFSAFNQAWKEISTLIPAGQRPKVQILNGVLTGTYPSFTARIDLQSGKTVLTKN